MQLNMHSLKVNSPQIIHSRTEKNSLISVILYQLYVTQIFLFDFFNLELSELLLFIREKITFYSAA